MNRILIASLHPSKSLKKKRDKTNYLNAKEIKEE